MYMYQSSLLMILLITGLYILKMFSFMNPMKMCWGMFISTLFMGLIIWKESSNSLMSSIIVLMYMSGVLLMFTIMSSLSPKSLTSKKMKLSMYLLVFLSYFFYSNGMKSEEWNMIVVKECNSSFIIMITINLVMFLYFFSISKIMMKEFLSVRYIS